MIRGKGRGDHRDPHRGWRRAGECRSWSDDEGGEQSGVELVEGDLLARRGKTGEGNERGEEWGCSWAAFIGREGGEAGRSRESNGGDRWCSLKSLVSQNKRATGGDTMGRLQFITEG
jgi:hypothetical protein